MCVYVCVRARVCVCAAAATAAAACHTEHQAQKACHTATDVGRMSGSDCKEKCMGNSKCIAASLEAANHATTGKCWIREKTGNEDSSGVCIDDHEAGNGMGGMSVAWQKSCDQKLCEGIFGPKPKTTMTTTKVPKATTANPNVGGCDSSTEYDAQPKATAAAVKLDKWCTDDSANKVINLKDWPGARFKIGCDYYARGLRAGIKCYGDTSYCIGEHSQIGQSYGHTAELGHLGTLTLKECETACTTVSNKFRGAHGGNGYCNTGCKWASDSNIRVAPSKSDKKCTKLTVCKNNEYEFKKPTSFSDRICKEHLVCANDNTVVVNDCVNFAKRLNGALLTELKAAGRSTKADHMFECYYGRQLAWPKDTCVKEAEFMAKFIQHPLKFSCYNRNQPVSFLRSADATSCKDNMQKLIDLSSIKTTTTTATTTTTVTVTTTTTTTTVRCNKGEYFDKTAAVSCNACPLGAYQPDASHRNPACKKHVPCSDGQFLATKGTRSTPNVCKTHSACTAAEFESAPADAAGDRKCELKRRVDLA